MVTRPKCRCRIHHQRITGHGRRTAEMRAVDEHAPDLDRGKGTLVFRNPVGILQNINRHRWCIFANTGCQQFQPNRNKGEFRRHRAEPLHHPLPAVRHHFDTRRGRTVAGDDLLIQRCGCSGCGKGEFPGFCHAGVLTGAKAGRKSEIHLQRGEEPGILAAVVRKCVHPPGQGL